MLRVEHGNRLEILARELADQLRADPNPPLVPEIVAVPNRGVARWLSFEFADRLGLCASIDFPTPTEVTFDCFRRLGLEVPEGTGTRPEVTTWAIASILGRKLSDPAFAPVANYVRPRDGDDPTSELRLHELSRRLAAVFDQYSVYRPQWVLAWESGQRAIETAAPAGIDAASLESLLADECWQSELWRGLAAKMPATGRHLARLSSELAELMKTSKGREKFSALPKRIFLFGTTSLAPAVVEVLKALGEHVDVTMFLPNPSRQFWGDIRPRRVIERDRSELPPEEGHRLLASLGTHVRDLHESLAGCPGGEHFEEPGWDSILRQIQSDILDLSPPNPRVLRPEDDSIRLHVCHGPMREVEVLHDQLLAMFEEDPSLRPRDVVVLAPDIEAYAPAVQAVFAERLEPSNGRGHPPLPFTIADRTLSAEQPLVSTFLDLLEIPGSRFEASAVLDLLECAALRQRIGLDDAAVDVAQQWIRGANVRWGIDESTAERLELPRRRENTWRFGFDRLFLGYAMSGSETWSAGPAESPILPYDEVEGTEAMVLGSLSTLFARLVRMDEEFTRPATPRAWSARLSALYADLFSATSDDSAASVQLRQAIKSIGANAALAGHEGEVGLEVVRSELARLLSGPGRSGRFLAGSITFASLQPMRSVPFRVVCLLGLNDDVFPRVERPQGFDLVSRSKRLPGDQSRRDDDRYLFLEALLAARDRLYLSHVGLDQRQNTEIPPSVVVSELLDVILDGWTTAETPDEEPEDGRARRAALLRRIRVVHKLQPFGRAYFEKGDAEGRPTLFSYSASMCAARAAAEKPGAGSARPLVGSALPRLVAPVDGSRRIDIADFVGFFAHPTKYFLRNRLEIRLDESRGAAQDREPLALDRLEAYGLRRAIFEGAEDGRTEEALRKSLGAQGLLPPGAIGEAELAEEWRKVLDVRAEVLGRCGGAMPERCEVRDLRVGEHSFFGFLEFCAEGWSVVDYRTGSRRPKDSLSLWIRHLLSCAHGRHGTSLYVTLDKGRVSTFEIPDVARETAVEELSRLVGLFDLGQTLPLRFFVETSRACAAGESVDGPWRADSENGAKESTDPWIRYAFRDVDPREPGGVEGDRDFEEVARMVWGPVLQRVKA